MEKLLSVTSLVALVFVVTYGFRPVVGPAWYLGGAGIPVALLVIAVLLYKF